MTEATTTETTAAKSKKPSHRLWMVEDQPEGKPANWTEIAALWETSSGDGVSGVIYSWLTVPPGARLVVLKAKEKK